MFPPIEPYRTGYLKVGDGHQIYWEECGNPGGKPVVILHGGPGSGCTPNNRRYYDPERWRIVLFDQRNCGRSKPHASETDIDLSTNTTHHLILDIEQLRNELKIEKWAIQGASWGATLALAYAETHPERVSELILLSATSGRRSETDLLTYGLGRMFRDAWKELQDFATQDPTDGPILDKMHRLLFSPLQEEAATAWCNWEMAILPTAKAPFPRYADPKFRLAFARLVTHFWQNGSWLEEGQLLRNAKKIAHIPGVILQGRLDLGNLSGTPWELAAALPNLKLIFVEESGHEGSPTFSDLLLDWTNRLL